MCLTMNIQEFNAQYLQSSPADRKTMSTDSLQEEFVSLLSQISKRELNLDSNVIKFIAHKSFNNKKNQLIVKQYWSIAFIFELIDSSQLSQNENLLRNLLDILSNITGITTDQCEYNYQTPRGTRLQVLPFKPASSPSIDWTRGSEVFYTQTLIQFLSKKSILTCRYAARSLLNFSNSPHIRLTKETIDHLSTMTRGKDKLTRMYIYAALCNYLKNKVIATHPAPALEDEFQHFQRSLGQNFKQHNTISRTDFERILNKYQTKSLWRWFWSQLGLMSKDSGTIFCLRQLLLQNHQESLSLAAIGSAINHQNNYDSKKQHRFRMFQPGTSPLSTNYATDQVINQIISKIQ